MKALLHDQDIRDEAEAAVTEKYKSILASKDAELADKNAELADKEAKLADKEAEIKRLKALLKNGVSG